MLNLKPLLSKKFTAIIFLFLFSVSPVFADVKHVSADADINIYPLIFQEGAIDPADPTSRFCGLRFNIVNPNVFNITDIIIDRFDIYSQTRAKVTKEGIGGDQWAFLKSIIIPPYKQFPFLDACLVFSPNSIDKYYSGEDTLHVDIDITYMDTYNKVYHKSFKFEYTKKKWRRVNE